METKNSHEYLNTRTNDMRTKISKLISAIACFFVAATITASAQSTQVVNSVMIYKEKVKFSNVVESAGSTIVSNGNLFSEGGLKVAIPGDQPLYNGVFSSPTITYSSPGGVNVGVGTFNAFTNATYDGRLISFNITSGSFTLTTSNTYWFLYADYNNGTPIYGVSANPYGINDSSQVLIASLYWEVMPLHDDLHVLSSGNVGKGSITKFENRLLTVPGLERYLGLALSSTGDMTFVSSSGYVWYGSELVYAPPLYSTNTNTYLWYHTNGVFTLTTTNQAVKQIYDNGSNIVATAPSKYVVNWIYETLDSLKHLDIVLGSGQYNSMVEARTELPPTPPLLLQYNSLLLGQLIVNSDSNNIQLITSAFTQAFLPVPVVNHNNLGNINGMAPYIHLGQVEYDNFVGGTGNWNRASTWVTANSNITTYSSSSNIVFSNISSNDFFLPIKWSVGSICRGGLYNVDTNAYTNTITLTFYENSNRVGSNAYWRANMALVVSPLVGNSGIGSPTCSVVDASGFMTNDLVYFQTVGSRGRISAITNNVLYFEDALLNAHSINEGVSRITEFGGFNVWDNAGGTNMFGRLTTTRAMTCTNRIEMLYKQ